jgi:hypothetical protein
VRSCASAGLVAKIAVAIIESSSLRRMGVLSCELT